MKKKTEKTDYFFSFYQTSFFLSFLYFFLISKQDANIPCSYTLFYSLLLLFRQDIYYIQKKMDYFETYIMHVVSGKIVFFLLQRG